MNLAVGMIIEGLRYMM